jgi:heme ABC exporter ATP-binding subunit CcmA
MLDSGLLDPAQSQHEPCGDEPIDASFAVQGRGLTVVRGRRVVVHDVHLAVSTGEMVALRGANGAGKTTLLHCLAGALRPVEGEVLWFGEPSARSHAARRQVGFLGHESGLYLALTAAENLLFASRMYGVDRVGERVDRLLASAGLARQTHEQAGRLSRGQRQRLAIARAIIHSPSILLLDEPCTGLDAEGCRWLEGLLGQLRGNGCAIVIASHDVEDAAFDRSLVLDGGRLC